MVEFPSDQTFDHFDKVAAGLANFLATVVEFPSDQTFSDHFDKVAAGLANFLVKVVKFKVALGGS